jgi:ATP-dependent exoDNAse (exonuclease V) alpha subunit
MPLSRLHPRSGEKILDERTGEIHDYTRKQGVQHSEIVVPDHAPDWAHDRNALWNAAEQAETRKNSTVVREFEIAIPKELSAEQGKTVIQEFTQKLVEKHGFAAEFSIHKDHEKDWQGKEKGFEGYHAHILCSTRRLETQGFTEKTRELDGGQRGKEEVEYWREEWAKTANEHLKEANIDKKIDHRSLKEQGIEREPTMHLGVAATAKERRGEETEIGEANRRIEMAYEQGLQERKELEELSPLITRYGICIRSALEDREDLKKLTQKMDRGADDFVKRFEALQKQRERERELTFERYRSRGMER